MKTSQEITAPVYLQLYTKNGLETDNVITELIMLSETHDVADLFNLEGISPSLHDADKNIVYFSVTIIPSLQRSVNAVEYIKSIFENLFTFYPKYTEPL